MNIDLRNKIIYQVFPRQHSKTSDFKGVIADLDRIKDLGVDIVYLLPIHPIGIKNKKGSLGCPYSIRDYRRVNPDLGTLEDFILLINEVHKRKMKLMIDVVYNHTSRDSVILNEHPEWMFKNDKGEFCGKVGAWWDVTDLDYSSRELRNELIDTLCYWAKLGVDGFRCDVASLVPVDFWNEAVAKLKEINSDFIMLAESIDADFVKHVRDNGFDAHSDCELYQAFDALYDYDIWYLYDNYLKTRTGLNDWLKGLILQEKIYPKAYVKAHCLENHDRNRAAEYIDDKVRLRNLNALVYFLKGVTFIYAGQEACTKKLESLFDVDLIDWSTLGKYDMVSLMKKCAELKKMPILKDGAYNIHLSNLEIVHLSYRLQDKILECIFNVGNTDGYVDVLLKDGKYVNLFNDKSIVIKDNRYKLGEEPVIIEGNIVEKQNN